MGALIAIINKKGRDATERAVAMLKMLKHDGIKAFGIASSTIVKIEKSIEDLQNQNLNMPTIVGHAFSKIFASDKPQPIKLENAALVFEGRFYPTSPKFSDMEIVAQKLQNRKEAVNTLFDSEGCFAFAMVKSEKIVAGRDVMGISPFYWGENLEFAALASERKALWKIGIKNVKSFPPGHVALVDRKGFQFQRVKTLAYSKAKQASVQAAAKQLEKLLLRSVQDRVFGINKVAVAFSGGLDSSLIAFLAKTAGANVHLIHVSLKNQSETEHAKKAAEMLNLPLHVHLYSEKDVEKILPRVFWSIEEPDSIKASIGVPFFWTAEKVAKMGLKVLLAGQGADELFGGYKRYVNDYLRYGNEKVHRILFNDVLKMYETNFERDFKICNFHNVELRLPFATYQLSKFAINLPVTLKIRLPDDGLRKLVLRQATENLGLPQLIVKRPKKAMQYATGVNKIFSKLASKAKLSVKEYLQQKFQTTVKKMIENE